MPSDSPARARYLFFLCIALLLSSYLQGQVGTSGDRSEALKHLMMDMKDHQGCARSVTAEQMKTVAEHWRRVNQWVVNASPDEMSRVLPGVLKTLAGSDEEMRTCAGVVLLDAALRPDSAQVLAEYIPALGGLLNDSPDEQMQRSIGITLTLLKPKPPPEVIPPFLLYLKRADRKPLWQAATVGSLLRVAPADPEVLAATQEFWSRPLDREAKEAVLNGIGNSQARDARLVTMVVNSLDDPEQGVQFTAVQVIRRMGKDAVKQAETKLRALATSTEEPPGDENARRAELQIREFAREALRLLDAK